MGMRMRVAPSEFLFGFQVEVGPFEAEGGSGRPKYLSSDPAAGAAFTFQQRAMAAPCCRVPEGAAGRQARRCALASR